MTSRQDWPKPDLLQQHNQIVRLCRKWRCDQ